MYSVFFPYRTISLLIITILSFVLIKDLKSQIIEKIYIVNDIEFTGIKTTKEKTILREIEIKKGDTIHKSEIDLLIKQTQNNIMNTSLFNFVEVYYVLDTNSINTDEEEHINIHIKCTERWYIWPVPILKIEERNFNDWLIHKNLSKISWGALIFWDNFLGRRQQFFCGFMTGFNDIFSIKYTNPFIDKNKNIGIGISVNYERTHNSYYKTEDNKLVMLNLENDYAVCNKNIKIHFTRRYGIYTHFKLSLKYDNYTFSDTLFALNPYFIEPRQKNLEFTSFSMYYKFDYRDYIHYPLEGSFFDCEISKQGFEFFDHCKFSVVNIKSSYKKYWKLAHRLYFAGGILGNLRLDRNPSYYFKKRLGFGNDYVRGFEQYVIDGEHFMLLKTNTRYNIIPPRVIKINFIRTEKFNTIPYHLYINFFSDAGYIRDSEQYFYNSLSNRILYGYGIGIDIVSYYNMVFRFEISSNSEKEFSFAIKFDAPI